MKMPQHPRTLVRPSALARAARTPAPEARHPFGRLGLSLWIAACAALPARAAIEPLTPDAAGVVLESLQEPAAAKASAPARPIIAVLDFETGTLPDNDVNALSQALWTRVASDRGLAILPREATRRWLIRNDLLPGMPYAPRVPLEHVTSALRVDYLVTGRLDRVESTYVLSLSIFDGHTRQPAFETSTLRETTLAAMLQSMDNLAGVLQREVSMAQTRWSRRQELQAIPASEQPPETNPAEPIAPPHTAVKAGADAKRRLSDAAIIEERTAAPSEPDTPTARRPARTAPAATEPTHAPTAEEALPVPQAHEPEATAVIPAAAPTEIPTPAPESAKREVPATHQAEPTQEPKPAEAPKAPEAPEQHATPAAEHGDHAEPAAATANITPPHAPEEPAKSAASKRAAAAEKETIMPSAEPQAEPSAIKEPAAPTAAHDEPKSAHAPEAPTPNAAPKPPQPAGHAEADQHAEAVQPEEKPVKLEPSVKTAAPEVKPAPEDEAKAEAKVDPKSTAKPAAKPGDSVAARKLLEQAKKLERGDKRLALLRQAAEANPGDAEPWRVLAGDEYALKHFERSVAACDDGLKANPNNSTLLTIKSSALFELKQFDPALEASRAALAADPSNNWARYNQALALMQQGSPDEAKAWNDYIEHAEQDKDHTALLANARWRLDELNKNAAAAH